MSRRVIRVDLAGPGSLVRGHGSREMIETITGRPPMWVPTLRGWSVQESTARDLVSLAEERGCDVLITGRRAVERRQPDESAAGDSPATPAAPPAPEVQEAQEPGLW